MTAFRTRCQAGEPYPRSWELARGSAGGRRRGRKDGCRQGILVPPLHENAVAHSREPPLDDQFHNDVDQNANQNSCQDRAVGLPNPPANAGLEHLLDVNRLCVGRELLDRDLDDAIAQTGVHGNANAATLLNESLHGAVLHWLHFQRLPSFS